MKRIFVFFLFCLVISAVQFTTGCANMIPPTGGPRDSLPPVLIDADPKQGAFNSYENKIVLNFDEYIDLKDVRKNLIVSPVPKSAPTVTSHLKVITITMRDTLRPNTTYSMDFGRAVTDVNENNVLKNFTYTFSTGNFIDSLQYGGRVVMAYTGKADSTLIALLHNELDDSAVAKDRPRYVARIDSSGFFTFHHIRPGIYRLYALKDETGTYEYTSKAQTFAFADSAVDLTKNTSPQILYAYQDTSGFAKKPKKMLNPPKPATRKEDKEKIKRLVLSANLGNGTLDLHKQLEIGFASPVKTFDTTKIRFLTDSFVEIHSYRILLDSTGSKFTLKYDWKSDQGYKLILQKDFAEDSLGEKLLKVDTISFRTKKESDYGNLRLRFRNLDLTKHPVLLFMQGDKLMLSAPVGRSLRYNNKLFDPGDYELRVLYDTNQNGVWDPGDFWLHRQPEIVVPLRKKLTVKSNWDNEVDITL